VCCESDGAGRRRFALRSPSPTTKSRTFRYKIASRKLVEVNSEESQDLAVL